MSSRREQFFADVRQAVRSEQQPRLVTDADILSDDQVARALRGAARWLAPKVVENYSADDFEAWPTELRDYLAAAVEGFRTAAAHTTTNGVPTRDQFRSARDAFRVLTDAVGTVVRSEWTGAVGRLIGDIEAWAAELSWRSRRNDRVVTETLLGRYVLPQLQVFDDTDLYVFEPVARFVPGAAGAYDVSIQPASNSTALYRDSGGHWKVQMDSVLRADGPQEVWSKDAFEKTLIHLRASVLIEELRPLA